MLKVNVLQNKIFKRWDSFLYIMDVTHSSVTEQDQRIDETIDQVDSKLAFVSVKLFPILIVILQKSQS